MTSPGTRDRLVKRLRDKGIKDERVLAAIMNTPRHAFVDEALNSRAYEDTALPIGQGQTISQPWIVARMTEALLEGGGMNKVLEVGTGSGYQAAVLAQLVQEVFTVERIKELLRSARRLFHRLRLNNVHARHADGHAGWASQAPFDGVMVTAAARTIPEDLVAQLRVGGRLVMPLDRGDEQRLLRIERTEEGFDTEDLGGVVFVPMLSGLA
ncbi:MAG: protein-L-isoaspartate(D-aspartate) O-methyltransferase [Xanthomonadales bacterium]|nr:protein-L-isoaspartate(D-aspartate) O-methyltransferase [Xanthomonadales bacterium]